jgi:VWFA-related protein
MQPSGPAVPRKLALLLASLAACLAVPHAAARQQPQQQPTPRPEESDEVVRVTTDLVQTDVTVIDREGNFVDGLKAEQFELKVDGKPRPVLFFERVSAGSRDESAQLAAARGGRAAGGASATGAVPLDRGRAILVFVDDIHLSHGSLVLARKMLTRFIDAELRQNDRMLVASATGQIGFLQQLTDERAVLRAALARLSARAQAARDFESPRMSVAQAAAIEANDRQLFNAFVDMTLRENPAFGTGAVARRQAENYVQARAQALAAQANNAAMRALQSLLGLLRTSAQFPGRKVLYFISDGFVVQQRDDTVRDLLRRVADASLRAGVVIYTVDARGLSAQIPEAMTAAERGSFDPTGLIMASNLNEAAETQSPLHTLAADTGGRAILNTNALGAAIGRTLKETSVYYLLAWRPEPEDIRSERFRRIEVAVHGRPDLSVLAQRGFYSTPPEARANADTKNEPKRGGDGARDAAREAGRELTAALRAPLPRAGVPTALTLNYAKAPDERIMLSALVQIEFEATQPAAGAPAPTDRVEVLVALYDADGTAVESFQREISVTARPGTPPRPTRTVVASFQTFLKPGLYQVRAASRDPKNGRTGSDVQWIEVPNLARGNFAMSSIFLGRPPAAPGAAAADDGPQVQLTADRRFRRDGRLRFIVNLYNATVGGAGQPDAAIQLQIFRDDQPVVTTPLKKINTEGVTDLSRLPYAAEVSLADLPAGRYALQLTAIDRLAKASVTQRVKFTIE